jgi:hypothetical protein
VLSGPRLAVRAGAEASVMGGTITIKVPVKRPDKLGRLAVLC